MRRKWLFVLAIAPSLSVAALAAQQEVFRGSVDLISVDVVVLDKAGRPVPGLTPADFDVTVNGKKDTVKALYYVNRVKAVADATSQPRPTAAGAAAPAASAPATTVAAAPGQSSVQRPYTGRSILIGVNDISFHGLAAQPYTSDIAAWVKTLDPADYVGVMTGSFRVSAPFSRDRAKVLETLRDAGAGQMETAHTGDVRLSIEEARAIDENVGNSLDTFLQMITNNNVPEPARVAWARECPDKREYQMCFLRFRNEAQDTATQMDDFRMRTAEAVKVFLETLRSAPPPRVLVLLADGAPMDDRTQFRTAITAAGDAGAQIFIITPETNRASTASDRDHTFSVSDIPVESRGDQTFQPKSMAAMRYEDDEYLKAGLARIADETGGRVFRVTTSATPALGRITESTSGFYRLGLSVPAELSKSESVPLKVQVKRSGTQVTAASRLRFPTVVSSPEPVMVAGNAKPAITVTPAPAVAPRVSAFPVAFTPTLQRADAGDRVRVVISADVPNAASGPMKVTAVFRNDAGQVVNAGTSELAADDGGVHRGGFALTVPAGDYRLRVTATDSGGREGWVDRNVAVSLMSLAGMPASDVLISWAGADRQLRRAIGERVPDGAVYLVASVELYPGVGSAALPTLELSVRSADGTEAYSSDIDADQDDGKLVAMGRIPLDTLKPGRYEVRIAGKSGAASAGVVSTSIVVPAR